MNTQRHRTAMRSLRVKATTPLLLIGLLALSPNAFAQAADIKGNMKALADLALMFAPFLGFLVFSSGVYQFYKHAKTRDERYGTASSIFKILAGSMLVSINWFYGLLASSFVHGTSTGDANSRMMLAIDAQMANGIEVAGAAGTVVPADTIAGLLGFVAFVGILAFINGLLALKNMGDGRHDERDLYKAITRIVGGLVCLNIKWVSCFTGSIFGVSMFCS